MAVKSQAVSLNASTATLIVPAIGDGSGRQSGRIKNNDGSIAVYVGGSDVTSSNGFPLAAGVEIPIQDLGYGDAIYAIAASGTPAVRVIYRGA